MTKIPIEKECEHDHEHWRCERDGLEHGEQCSPESSLCFHGVCEPKKSEEKCMRCNGTKKDSCGYECWDCRPKFQANKEECKIHTRGEMCGDWCPKTVDGISTQESPMWEEEFDEKLDLCECEFELTGELQSDRIKSFIRTAIETAIKEERVRILGEVEAMKAKYLPGRLVHNARRSAYNDVLSIINTPR